jgi:hypothetical protein
MGTPFKLRSGNASAFKNMGSSPVKQQFGKPTDTKSGEPKPGERDTPKPKRHTGEGKAMLTKTSKKRPTINVPKGYGPNISDEERAKSKGTLKGITGFEADYPIVNKMIKLTNPVSTTKRKVKNVTTITKDVVKKGKKVYDYFTKK